MKTHDLTNRLTSAANCLEDRGFACLSDRTADEMARAFSASTFPLRLFLAWLARTPEAADEIAETLLTVTDRTTGPAIDVATTHAEGLAAGLKCPAVYQTQKSEPEKVSTEVPKGEQPATESRAESKSSPTGVRGASAPSRVVTLGDAAAALGRPEFRTRPVKPADIEPKSLGLTEGFRGQAAVASADGKPLRAVARFHAGEQIVEFLDKRGPLLLTRVVGGKDAGSVVTICIEFVEPRSRAAVLEALDKLPGAKDEYNFSPFDGSPDPWIPEKTISHHTTVIEEPTFIG